MEASKQNELDALDKRVDARREVAANLKRKAFRAQERFLEAEYAYKQALATLRARQAEAESGVRP